MARNPENISSAVGQPSIDIPLGGRRTPDIRAPKKGLSAKSKIVGTAILAGAVGLSAFGVYEATRSNNNQEPQPTSVGGVGGNPIPEITPSPVVTIAPSETPIVTPTPEVTPTPTPEATPVPSIENVKLVSEGSAAMEITGPPDGIFNIYNATVVAVVKDPETNNIEQFAVTVAGKKITRICSDIFKDLCSYKGVTFWINVKDLTLLADMNYEPAFKKLGEGPKDISKYIEVGRSVPLISMYFNSVPKYTELNAPNLNTYNKLNNSIGKTFPRSYKGFTFNAGGVSVQP